MNGTGNNNNDTYGSMHSSNYTMRMQRIQQIRQERAAAATKDVCGNRSAGAFVFPSTQVMDLSRGADRGFDGFKSKDPNLPPNIYTHTAQPGAQLSSNSSAASRFNSTIPTIRTYGVSEAAVDAGGVASEGRGDAAAAEDVLLKHSSRQGNANAQSEVPIETTRQHNSNGNDNIKENGHINSKHNGHAATAALPVCRKLYASSPPSSPPSARAYSAAAASSNILFPTQQKPPSPPKQRQRQPHVAPRSHVHSPQKIGRGVSPPAYHLILQVHIAALDGNRELCRERFGILSTTVAANKISLSIAIREQLSLHKEHFTIRIANSANSGRPTISFSAQFSSADPRDLTELTSVLSEKSKIVVKIVTHTTATSGKQKTESNAALGSCRDDTNSAVYIESNNFQDTISELGSEEYG
jgi:hypothetical protein